MRELENVIERAVVLTPGPRIGVELIPDHVRKAPNFQMPQFVVPPEGISFKDVITDFEKRLIESTLEAAGGVQKRAAELLHIKPTTLNEMIKRVRRSVRAGTQDANGDRHAVEPAADRRRRPEARRRAAAHQADDAERDDQAVRDPAAAEAPANGNGDASRRRPSAAPAEPVAARRSASADVDRIGRGVRREVSRHRAFLIFAKSRSYLPSTTSQR